MTTQPGAAERRGEIAHTLKNHLSIILGFSELLVSELAADDPHRADAVEIQKAARDAIALVDAHLKPPPDPEPTS